MKSKVFFTKRLDGKALIDIFNQLNFNLKGNVAVKLHSGEDGNKNFLPPEYVKPLVEHVNGTVVECNTAYSGERNTTDKHLLLLKKHKWTEYFNVDLLDKEGPDLVLDIENGKVIKKDFVGKNIKNYDSALVLSHFKGHPMGGYGGALKQLSIGFASNAGKAYIHSAGKTDDQYKCWDQLPEQDKFLESMADAASAVVKYFKGNMAFVSVMKNISVDCDCVSNAEAPCMDDIGILASLDPVAIDQAALDIVFSKTSDKGLAHFKERVESRHGVHTIEAAEELGFGSRKYELIEIE